jgi:hypothetical protein
VSIPSVTNFSLKEDAEDHSVLAWNIGNSHHYIQTSPTYDWNDPGFGNGFAVYVLHIMYAPMYPLSCSSAAFSPCPRSNFQICYLSLFWLVGELAETSEEVVRIAGLLRATESASQAISYGLSSIPAFANIYSAVVNLCFWGVSVVPGWLIVRQIGVKYSKE